MELPQTPDGAGLALARSTYWARRTRRHALLAFVSAASTAAQFQVLVAKDAIWRISMATAYTSLGLLAVSLLVGPWNVLRRRPNPVSTDLRRDIGIWAAACGLTHVAFGLQVHLRGKMLQYFLYPPEQRHRIPFRRDAFGFANYTGLGATLVLALLLALSNDLSLRALGPARWKSLQRWNYVGFALMLLHGAAYQVIEKRAALFVGVFGAVVLLVVSLQAAGYRRVKRG